MLDPILVVILACSIIQLICFCVIRFHKPSQPQQLKDQKTYIYSVTITEYNSDGMHIHNWFTPMVPTKEVVTLLLMTETDLEMEKDFSIDAIAEIIKDGPQFPCFNDELDCEFKTFWLGTIGSGSTKIRASKTDWALDSTVKTHVPKPDFDPSAVLYISISKTIRSRTSVLKNGEWEPI